MYIKKILFSLVFLTTISLFLLLPATDISSSGYFSNLVFAQDSDAGGDVSGSTDSDSGGGNSGSDQSTSGQTEQSSGNQDAPDSGGGWDFSNAPADIASIAGGIVDSINSMMDAFTAATGLQSDPFSGSQAPGSGGTGANPPAGEVSGVSALGNPYSFTPSNPLSCDCIIDDTVPEGAAVWSGGNWVTQGVPSLGDTGAGSGVVETGSGGIDTGAGEGGGGDSGYVPPETGGAPVQSLTSVSSEGCNSQYPVVRFNFTASYSPTTVKFEVWRYRRDLDNWTLIRDVGAPGSYLDRTLDSNSYQATYVEYFIRRVDNTYGNLDTNHLSLNANNCTGPTQTLTSAVNAGCSGNNPLVNVSFSGSSSPTTVKFEIWRWRRDLDNWSVAKEVSSPGTYTDDRLDSNSSSATYTEYFIRRVDNRFGNIDSNHTTVNVSNCSPPSPFNQNPPQASCPAQNTPRLVLSWGSSANARNYIVAYRDLSDGGGGVERIYGDVGLSLSTEVTGLTPGHSYGFLIIAQNIVGSDLVSIYSNNAWSDTVSLLGPVTYPDCVQPNIYPSLTSNNRTTTISDPPLPIRQNEPVTISWTTTNVPDTSSACNASIPAQLSNGKATPANILSIWNGNKSNAGSLNLPQITTVGTYPFTLNCTGFWGFSNSATISLIVNQLQKPYIQTTGGAVHTNEFINIPQ